MTTRCDQSAALQRAQRLRHFVTECLAAGAARSADGERAQPAEQPDCSQWKPGAGEIHPHRLNAQRIMDAGLLQEGDVLP